jgi:hypothetical protein
MAGESRLQVERQRGQPQVAAPSPHHKGTGRGEGLVLRSLPEEGVEV